MFKRSARHFDFFYEVGYCTKVCWIRDNGQQRERRSEGSGEYKPTARTRVLVVPSMWPEIPYGQPLSKSL